MPLAQTRLPDGELVRQTYGGQAWLARHEYMCFVYEITLRTYDISVTSRSPRRRLYPPACKPYGLEAEPEARAGVNAEPIKLGSCELSSRIAHGGLDFKFTSPLGAEHQNTGRYGTQRDEQYDDGCQGIDFRADSQAHTGKHFHGERRCTGAGHKT